MNFIYSYGSTLLPCSSSKCLSKLSFKRVKKARGAFRRLGGLVSPGRKEELEQKFISQGLFEYTEQTTQVGLRPALLNMLLSTDSTCLIL